jgi:hypothetical protein
MVAHVASSRQRRAAGTAALQILSPASRATTEFAAEMAAFAARRAHEEWHASC